MKRNESARLAAPKDNPLALAGVSADVAVPPFLPQDLRRRRRGVPAANVLGANETLNVGFIGTGGRCRHLMKSLAKIPDVRIAAVCDIWDAAPRRGAEARRPEGVRHQGLRRAARPQGHRRRPDRQRPTTGTCR